MSFPLDFLRLRTLTEEVYAENPDETKYAPKDFRPLDDLLPLLTESERSFCIYSDKLYLNWSELSLVSVFDSLLDELKSDEFSPEDVPVLHCVSAIFRRRQATTDYEEWAIISVLQAIDQVIGYDTQCGDYIFGFTLADIEQSYQAYSRDIEVLPDFHEELRALLGERYEMVVKYMYSLLPEPME